MALSLGIRCGGNRINGVVDHRIGKLSVENRCGKPWYLMIGSKGKVNERVSMSATVTNAMSLEPFQKYGHGEEEQRRNEATIPYARLDEMMRESVAEIVKNLREAPLLVRVYSKNRDSDETTTLRTGKKVKVEDWPIVKYQWEGGESPIPEGVIFVEELGGTAENEGEESREERTTRVWGIVVQGKGAGYGPACYLLKTSRVGSGPGLGLCCTHFCLVRAKNFRETAKSQLKNCWLLQGQ